MRSPSLLGLAGVLLAAGASLAFAPHSAHQAHESPLAIELESPDYQTVRIENSAFSLASRPSAGIYVQTNERTHTPHIAYGGGLVLASGIEVESAAIDAARSFVLAESEMLGTRADNLEVRDVVHARGKWVVHFRQVVGGIPVHGGRAFVALGESGKLAAFGSDFVPETDGLVSVPTLSRSDAIGEAAAALATSPRTDFPMEADLHYVPIPVAQALELVLGYRVRFEADEPLGSWETWVDASTGAILGRRNRIDLVNVIGNSDGDVQFHGYCDGVSNLPMANLTVVVTGGNNDETDANGDFDIVNGGAGDVLLSAQLLGPFINVNRFGGLGADASWLGNATPGVPVQISWNAGNARQDERDCFYNANLAHDFIKAIEPSFTGLDFSMATWVGRTDGFCPGNAWWSPGSSSINFCEAAGGFANTGEIGNVVYHEYGHGANDFLYAAHGANLPSGDMHEGNADILANYIDRNSIIGIGFTNCAGGIRDADNTLQWPEDNNGSHFGGQIIAGFAWDSWQSLLGTFPSAQADSIAWHTWHFARAMGTPVTQPNQVFWTFMADDDDADLTNGTPNYSHFCLAAENHGFDCPEITAGVFITHAKLPHSEDGSLGFDVVATIVSTVTTLDPAQLLVEYRVNGGSFNSLLMSPTANPDEFTAHIPALNQFSEVEYYISAADLAANTKTDPEAAPFELHAFDVALDVDDLESGQGGWTIGAAGDDATQGIWELIDPNGTTAQPADDATPDPGTMAFITGQCAPGEGGCAGFCYLQCNDVDGGKTTLTSPVYDLAAATAAKVKYDRWYSNDTWLSPGIDHWRVDVSNDGGSSWTNFEDTTASNAAWQSFEIDINAIFGAPDQVRVRFVADDMGNDSVVEAGVDEFRVLADLGGGVGVEPIPAGEPLAFALSQNRPNPFRPSTEIRFSIPSPSEVDLSVYNVSGQRVRRLADGPMEAGSYRASWDGRDAGGQRVASGVYLYRLESSAGVLTRKMTYMQ